MLDFDIDIWEYIINTYSSEYLFIYTIRCVSKSLCEISNKNILNRYSFRNYFLLKTIFKNWFSSYKKKRTNNSWVKNNRRCSDDSIIFSNFN